MTSCSERAFATRTVHHPRVVPPLAPVATPIYQTSTYQAESTATLAEFASASQPTSFYTRYGNPTVEVWERVIADLEEGARGLAFASGMAAISCVLTGLLQPGDHVVAGNSLYTATLLLMTEHLPRMGVAVDFADATLVHLARRLEVHTILTVDHDDFETYRIEGRRRFRVLPARR